MHLSTLGVPATRAGNRYSKRVNRLLDVALAIEWPRAQPIPVIASASESVLAATIADLILELLGSGLISDWLLAMTDDHCNITKVSAY